MDEHEALERKDELERMEQRMREKLTGELTQVFERCDSWHAMVFAVGLAILVELRILVRYWTWSRTRVRQ